MSLRREGDRSAVAIALAGTIDTLLDRSVALGYGNVGLAIRRRLAGWPADPPRIDGHVVAVTGAGSGIGLAAAEGFARLGASVRAIGRDDDRAAAAAGEVLRRTPGADVRPIACDVSSLRSLRAFADELCSSEQRLDVLVNNAGVMPADRRESADGVELTFATHVLAPFVLIDLLGDLLRANGGGRVINVASGGLYGQSLRTGDLQTERVAYGPKKVYAHAKRAQLVITEQWAERHRGDGLVVHAMHPGWVDTKGVRESMPLFRTLTRPILRTSAEGADTIVWLGAAAEPLCCTGGFWHDRRLRPTHYLLGASADTAEDRDALWEACVALSRR